MSLVDNKLSLAQTGTWSRYLCATLIAFSAYTCIAQTEEYGESVEEVVVTGERPLRLIRAEVIEAENAVFDYFNEIYAGTDYEMICKRERQIKNPLNPIPNSWAVRSCRSKRAHELHEQAMEDYGEYVYLEDSGEIGIPLDAIAYETDTKEHGEMLNQKVKDLLIENPEYREKFRAYTELKTEYDGAVAADYEKGNFFTRLFKGSD